jgi:rSAM/selenodomain-associated transferase 1
METMTSLVVFGREPVPGQVKTRLADVLGAQGACDLYRALLFDTLTTCQAVAGATTHFLHAGERLSEGFRTELASLPLKEVSPQCQVDDLGGRMAEALAERFAAGADRVLIVGSDLPSLSVDDLAVALSLLAPGHPVVGPASDGGYYLIGLQASDYSRRLFEGITWSTDTVLTTTLARLADLGLVPRHLREQRDVDRPQDLVGMQPAAGFVRTSAWIAANASSLVSG